MDNFGEDFELEDEEDDIDDFLAELNSDKFVSKPDTTDKEQLQIGKF